jgi:hypothetical protein
MERKKVARFPSIGRFLSLFLKVFFLKRKNSPSSPSKIIDETQIIIEQITQKETTSYKIK